MTSPEVDSELERLFSVTREATLPDAGARARIRAGLDARLSAGDGAAAPRATQKLWFGVGAAVIGVGVAALWLSGAPRGAARPVSATNASVAAPRAVTNASGPAFSAVVEPPLVAGPARAEPAARPPAAQAGKSTESVKSGAAVKPSSASSAAADPAEELTLVRAMQRALRAGDASQALSLAAEHARRFPKGALVEEREGARAIANCQLAVPEARATVLETFTRRFGASPYAARVKAACQ